MISKQHPSPQNQGSPTLKAVSAKHGNPYSTATANAPAASVGDLSAVCISINASTSFISCNCACSLIDSVLLLDLTFLRYSLGPLSSSPSSRSFDRRLPDPIPLRLLHRRLQIQYPLHHLLLLLKGSSSTSVPISLIRRTTKCSISHLRLLITSSCSARAP